jgi:hypothetical protein
MTRWIKNIARTGKVNIEDGLFGWKESVGSRGNGLDLSGSGQGPVSGLCGHGNGRLSVIEGEEFLENLIQYQCMQ